MLHFRRNIVFSEITVYLSNTMIGWPVDLAAFRGVRVTAIVIIAMPRAMRLFCFLVISSNTVVYMMQADLMNMNWTNVLGVGEFS